MNRAIHRWEQKLLSTAMLVMGAVVFLDVVHRVLSRLGPTGTGVALLLAWRVVASATQTRWWKAALWTVLGWGVLSGFVWALPNGLVWSQTLGLVLMLGVACVGASTATQEKRHLAMDAGSLVWPARWRPRVHAVGNVVTSGFCAVMAGLSALSIRDHLGDYLDTGGAGGAFVALPIPRFAAFLVIPVAFSVMAVRFLLQAREREPS